MSAGNLASVEGRAPFIDALDAALATARAQKRRLAVILVGLDRFKVVNDALGPQVGDLVLEEAARRVREVTRHGPTAPLARLGGDVFGVLVPCFGVAAELRALAASLLGALRAPFRVGANELRLAASAGLAVAPSDGDEARMLLRGAGAALHRAKHDGGGCYRFFSANMGDEALRRLALENQLARAWEAGEFALHYQPIVGLATGRASGVEALLRWNHPLHGVVPAGMFVDVAESIGLVDAMQSWTLETACAQAAAWEREGHGPLEMSVNLGARALGEGHLARTVSRILEAHGLPPARLQLEITETALVRSTVRTERTLEGLRALGVRLALDDFGTGYSSLAYLKRLPVDRVKIDRAFLSGLGRDARAEGLLGAIIGLARVLGIEAVAEGVEDDAQLAALRGLGCDAVQGYLFAPALPAGEVPAVLAHIAQPASSLRAPTRAASSTALLTPIFSKILAR